MLSGTASIIPYVKPGPLNQTFGFGYGTGLWSGSLAGAISSTLNGSLADDAQGNNGSATNITLVDASLFPTTGEILVGGELITYTGKSSNDLTGITRGAAGTATFGTSNGQAHSDGAVVTNATNFSGFGSAVEASSVTLEPGLWSLSNFGEVLVATIANGKTFTWDAGAANPTGNRAATNTSGFETDIGKKSFASMTGTTYKVPNASYGYAYAIMNNTWTYKAQYKLSGGDTYYTNSTNGLVTTTESQYGEWTDDISYMDGQETTNKC